MKEEEVGVGGGGGGSGFTEMGGIPDEVGGRGRKTNDLVEMSRWMLLGVLCVVSYCTVGRVWSIDNQPCTRRMPKSVIF